MPDTVPQIIARQSNDQSISSEIRNAWRAIVQHGGNYEGYIRIDDGRLTLSRTTAQITTQLNTAGVSEENRNRVLDALSTLVANDALRTSNSRDNTVYHIRAAGIRATNASRANTNAEHRLAHEIAERGWQRILGYANRPDSDLSFLSIGANHRINIDRTNNVARRLINERGEDGRQSYLGSALDMFTGGLGSRVLEVIPDTLLPTANAIRPRQDSQLHQRDPLRSTFGGATNVATNEPPLRSPIIPGGASNIKL